jgi:hypothetical protein
MTLTLPGNDEIAAGMAGPSGAQSPALTLAGR